jgi:hypothetical protein
MAQPIKQKRDRPFDQSTQGWRKRKVKVEGKEEREDKGQAGSRQI